MRRGLGFQHARAEACQGPLLNRPTTHNKPPVSSPRISALCHALKRRFSRSFKLALRPLTPEHRAAACETQGSP